MINLDYKNILKQIVNEGYYVLEDFAPKAHIELMREHWVSYFKSKKYSDGKKNIHKTGISLGDENFLAYSFDKDIKMLRKVEYLWNKPTEKLSMDYAIKLNQIRNKLMNKDDNYGLVFSPEQIAMHLQINFYPAEEGFMYQHVDGSQKYPMINITMNLTNKNEDFEDGGIELIKKNNQKINLDDLSKPGDIIIFDGNLKHEVKMITSKKGIGRIGIFPIIIRFYKNQEIPHFLKKAFHAYFAIQRRLGLLKKDKLPNEI